MSREDEMGLTPEAANGYEEFFVPAIFHQWPPIMISTAAVEEGENVLDVGCGTGVLTRELVQNVGAAGRATGFDLSESMLGVARDRCPDATFEQGNVVDLPFDDGSFDVVISSFMLMFVPDPEEALREMRRVLEIGGRLVVSVWQGLENNVVYSALVDATREVAGGESADSLAWPFALGEADRFEGLFRSAGMEQVDLSHHDGTATFPSVEDFVATEIQAWLLADSVDAEQMDAIVSALRTRHPPFRSITGPVTFPLNALVAKVNAV
ncbi:MAG: methyltransferase domain-containing protein [Acidobacteriota bacterium]